jgi:hypothetical protein
MVCGSIYEREQDRDMCMAQHIMGWLPELKKEFERQEPQTRQFKALPSAAAKMLPHPGDVAIFYVGRNTVRGIVVAEDHNNWYVLNIDNLNAETIDKYRKMRVCKLNENNAAKLLTNANVSVVTIYKELEKYRAQPQQENS